jgi:hypothetical protein
MKSFFKTPILVIIVLCSCNTNHRRENTLNVRKEAKNEVIVDCQYTLKEAISGSKAPQSIIKQLQLIDVRYYSTDGKIHQGQVLANKKMADKIKIIFQFILANKFPVAHAIPVVKYNWNDDTSMQDNNTYSFCYRDISFSKHARGMAIDINPYFNPVRWKAGYENLQNKPVGAHYNPRTPGTFYKENPVVRQFKNLGFRWGHSFTAKYDDHHFEI